MSTSNKRNLVEFKAIFFIKLIFWAIFIFCIVSMLLFQIFEAGGERFFRTDEISVLQGFTVSTDEGEMAVTIPGHVKWQTDRPMLIRNTLPDQIPDGYHLYVCGVHQDVEVWIDGVLRAAYTDRDMRIWGQSSQTSYLRVPLTEKDAGKTICITLVTGIWNDAGEIGNILLGSDSGFYYFMIRLYGGTAVTAVILVIVGIVFIMFALIVNLIYGKKQGAHYVGAFAFMIGISILCGSHLRQFYFSNIPAAANLTYINIQLCGIPLLCYLDELQQYRFKSFYLGLKLLFLCNCFVCFILQILEIVDYGNSIVSAHALVVVATLMVCYCYIKDMIMEKRTEVVESFIALWAIAVFSALEIYNADVRNNPVWGQYIAIGVLLFLIMVSFTTLNQMQRREYESFRAIEENEAKTLFLANMSHEIRTPLNVVLGMDEMILRESNSEQLTEYAEAIRDSGTALLYLINNILDYSKVDSGRMEIVKYSFDFCDFLDHLCAVGKTRLLKSKVEFVTQINPDIPKKVFGDEQHLRQIVINFLSNAVKYTREGTVSLVADYQEIEDTDDILLDICVQDTGIGIKEEDKHSLFEAFTRMDLIANKNIEGTGLGLSIARQLADLLGGDIYFESEYGIGSVFGVRVRVTKKGEEKVGEYRYGAKSAKGQMVRRSFIAPECSILIVDDNSMNLDVMKELLRKTGMEIDVAENGEECLTCMCRKKYDIILLDHMMPGMDGIETLATSREMDDNLNQDTPVIAVTANAVAGARELFLQNGFQDFVSKPIDSMRLEETIVSYLPKESVFLSDSSESTELLTNQEMDRLRSLLKEFDINMDEGLGYTAGDVSQYAKFLEMYIRAYPKLLTELKDNLKKKTLEFYIIKVHAIKGNAKSIGALDLFYTAQRMESRGKQGDLQYLKHANQILLLEMQRARDGAELFLQETGLWSDKRLEEAIKHVKMESQEWEKALTQLLEYVQELQASEAKKLIREMLSYELEESQKVLCMQVEEQLEDMEYEKAETLLFEYENGGQ